MLDLSEIKRKAMNLHETALLGQDVAAPVAVAWLIAPLLELIETMGRKENRWLLLGEAITKSQRSENYFAKPIQALGDKTRLEIWKDEGFADQAESGVWLIHPRKVREARTDTIEHHEGEPTAGRLAKKEILARLRGEKR